MSNWSIDNDITNIINAVGINWESLRNSRIFLTGGTGFIGCWLLEAIRAANLKLELNIRVTVLTRRPEAFSVKAPHLALYSEYTFLAGDVANFSFPDGEFTHIIHAATDASAALNENDPRCMFDTILTGTRRVLDFALEKKIPRTLFLSSGAVYGQQPWEIEHVREDWTGAPNSVDPKAAYAEGKRAAEMLCSIYAKQFGLHISIARIFALLGPYLDLGIHFAAGNFIKDAMQGKPVIVKGNGLPCRSYLYASDLTIWLLHMLIRGESIKPYNLGSDESVSIASLAEKISKLIGNGQYEILGAADKGWNLGRYVPDTNLINQDLGLKRTVSLDDAILRTAMWNGWKEGNK
jgi:nucleoside-diphosphate-sugar epimerase